jgi:hypothetical protein
MDLKTLLFLKAASGSDPATEETVTGNPVVFQTSLARNLTGFTIPFETAGITGLRIFRTGKNLFDKAAPISSENHYLKLDGTESGSGNYNISGPIVAVAGTKYTLSGLTGGSPAICYFNAADERIGGAVYNNQSHLTTTAPDGTAYMKVSIPKAKVDEFMIEVGQEVTTYEAYTGNSFSVSFGETVNSGSFDAVTGKLTATDPAKIIDLQPVRVQTLIGTNTVWTDTGGTNTVKYKT